MDTRTALIQMLKQLLQDTIELHQQGAGYYSCIPIIERYNKLMEQARTLFEEGDGLAGTFDALPQNDPNDPADKMIVIQGLRIEAGQLITLLQLLGEDATEAEETAEEGTS